MSAYDDAIVRDRRKSAIHGHDKAKLDMQKKASEKAVKKSARVQDGSNEKMLSGVAVWRFKAVVCLLVLLALLLIWRIADHQVLRGHAFLEKQGDARTVRTEVISAHRGMIADRNGEPLAVSTPVVTLWANPKALGKDINGWREIADAMRWSKADLQEKMAQYGDKEFMYLKRHLSPVEAEDILALKIDGINALREYKRFYPAGEVVAQLVGFTNIDDKGQEGIELAYEDQIKGREGKRRVLKDLKGRAVKDLGVLRPEQNGMDVTLSIDLRVQYFAYTILKNIVSDFQALGGSAVVLDVATGEVLAMVSSPSFNPNNRAGIKPSQMRNRALVDVFEPGSTMKPITVVAALESGKYKPESRIDTTPGSIVVQGKLLKDHNNYGVIDLKKVIAKSSQVGVTKIALSLEPNAVRDMFHRFRFGQSTGTGFPGESSGVLPSYHHWRDLDRATLAFGHGVSVTTLQLAQAYGVLADYGVFKPSSLLRVDKPLSAERVVSEKIVRQVLPMMEAVTQLGGTGTRARVPSFRVAGKTGTVHKLGAGGYSKDRYMAMFAGLAPVSAPRYVIAVMIDEPHSGKYYGGEVAAPVFAQLMQGVLQLMGTEPDGLPLNNPDKSVVSESKSASEKAVLVGKKAA